MSVIFAGKKCHKCKQSYYISFGHTKWYDDVVKRRKPINYQYRNYERIRRKGLCPFCYTGTLTLEPMVKKMFAAFDKKPRIIKRRKYAKN